MNLLLLPFSYFILYSDSINLVNWLNLVIKKGLTTMFTKFESRV